MKYLTQIKSAIKRFVLRQLGHDKIVRDLRHQYYDLNAYVWQHAKFMDEKGNADTNYNKPQVQAHWNEFHSLNQKFIQSYHKALKG